MRCLCQEPVGCILNVSDSEIITRHILNRIGGAVFLPAHVPQNQQIRGLRQFQVRCHEIRMLCARAAGLHRV